MNWCDLVLHDRFFGQIFTNIKNFNAQVFFFKSQKIMGTCIMLQIKKDVIIEIIYITCLKTHK